MLHKAMSFIDKLAKFDEVNARCDFPNKVNDPGTAIIAALSIVRMMDLLIEASEKQSDDPLQTQSTISRCIALKKLEAAKVKAEIRVIWGDYSKAAQISRHPGVHDIVRQIMVKASICEQTVERKVAEELVELVNQFAEIFWNAKEIETVRKAAPYPPSMAVAYPVL